MALAVIESVRAEHPDLTLEIVDIGAHPDAAVRYGVMATPAIAINHRLAFTGVPREADLRRAILAEQHAVRAPEGLSADPLALERRLMRTQVGAVPISAWKRSLKGYLLFGVAFLACPCHLPLVLVVLAGTGLAGTLNQHFRLAFIALSLIFVVSLFSGLSILKRLEQRRTE